MKFAKNMYSLCSSSECETCIYFHESESKCLIGTLSNHTQAMVDNPVLVAYLFELKRAYFRYLDNASKSICERDIGYWRGMADSVLAIFNDLGFGYLLY